MSPPSDRSESTIPHDTAKPIAEVVADLRGHAVRDAWTDLNRVLQELGQLDRNVYAAIADSPTPTIDEPIRRLSDAANYSKLWIAVAAGLAICGGRPGRRAAATGLTAIGAASAIVNQGVKRLYERERPDRETEDVPDARRVRMPQSTSFPSGHSASGFAFATAVGSQLPIAGASLRFLAGAVAYSRVHTGVHYPGDAVVGSLIGASIGGLGGKSSATLGALRAPVREHRPRPTWVTPTAPSATEVTLAAELGPMTLMIESNVTGIEWAARKIAITPIFAASLVVCGTSTRAA